VTNLAWLTLGSYREPRTEAMGFVRIRRCAARLALSQPKGVPSLYALLLTASAVLQPEYGDCRSAGIHEYTSGSHEITVRSGSMGNIVLGYGYDV